MIKISIIIISYNSEDFIKNCINSVFKYKTKDSEVVVLDNASSDRTVEELNMFKDKINLIVSDKNLGFGKGINLAAKQSRGEYLFLLNPDTQVRKPFLDELVDFYNSDPNIGLIGVKTMTPNGNIQKSVKKSPSVAGAFLEFILGVKNAYSEYAPMTDKPIEVDVIYGAAVMIKRNLFEKLGGFSDKYFMYYEDVDLCKRVINLGKKIYYYPNTEITHLVGATKSSMDRALLNYQSSVIYHGHIGAFLLKIIFFAYRIKRRLFLS